MAKNHAEYEAELKEATYKDTLVSRVDSISESNTGKVKDDYIAFLEKQNEDTLYILSETQQQMKLNEFRKWVRRYYTAKGREKEFREWSEQVYSPYSDMLGKISKTLLDHAEKWCKVKNLCFAYAQKLNDQNIKVHGRPFFTTLWR